MKARKRQEKSTTTSHSSKDFYKRIRKREAAEKKRREKWSKEFKNNMSNYNNYTNISTAPNQYSGSMWTSGPATTVSSTSIAEPKIHIDGGENGSMRVDVPLIVNGRDVVKELDDMRDALLLLKRDVDMEAKYPKLKKIKDEYERALDMYKTFETIKESK